MMRNLNKTVLALLAASVMTTTAFAASDEGATDRIQSAKGSVEALTVTLENMGAEVDPSVNLNGAYTADQKVSIYNAKHAELQNQFDTLHAQSAE
jgi:hydroxypyruvate isomerase